MPRKQKAADAGLDFSTAEVAEVAYMLGVDPDVFEESYAPLPPEAAAAHESRVLAHAKRVAAHLAAHPGDREGYDTEDVDERAMVSRTDCVRERVIRPPTGRRDELDDADAGTLFLLMAFHGG